ncbi:MAG TPA: hypothetical protein VGU46_09775 [Acidobacteriaceae bacterium]|nr:hypothetical protein [Acidobacteriaceae bacterium]
MMRFGQMYRGLRLLVCSALLLAVVAVPGWGQAKRSHLPADMDARLRLYLQKELGPSHDKSLRYTAALVDRGDAPKEEVVVYVSGAFGTVCGSGGCTLLVFKPHGSSFQKIGFVLTMWPPVRALQTESKGLRDMSVGQCCLAGKGWEDSIRFNGHRYEKYSRGNQDVEVPAGTAGDVLISKDDEGRPVFGDR